MAGSWTRVLKLRAGFSLMEKSFPQAMTQRALSRERRGNEKS
jgi:hypothetical protein